MIVQKKQAYQQSRSDADRYTALLKSPWALAAGAALLYLLFALASMDSSSYWLHSDTPTQPVEALGRLNGWAYAGNKIVPMYILRGLYLIFSPSPQLEIPLFIVFGMISIGAYTMMARRALKSNRWAVLAALVYLSLPTTGYYLRIHIAYPLVFFLVGMVLYVHERFALATMMFAFAVLSHMSFSIPVLIWLVASTLTGLRPTKPAHIALWILTPLTIYLLAEWQAHRETGGTFYWLQAVQIELDKWITNDMAITADHLWVNSSLGNGILRTAFLVLFMAYPLIWQRENRVMNALYLAAVGLVGFYQIRAFQGIFVIGRLLAGAYPLLVILSLALFQGLLRRMRRMSVYSTWGKWLWQVGVSVLVPLSLISTLLELGYYSRTAYPLIDKAMQTAAQGDMAVYCFCNGWIPWYYNTALGVTAPSSDFNPEKPMPLPDHASSILIFEHEIGQEIREAIVQHWLETGFVDSEQAAHELLDSYRVERGPMPILAYPVDAIEQVHTTDDLRMLLDFRVQRPPIPQLELWYPPNNSN